MNVIEQKEYCSPRKSRTPNFGQFCFPALIRPIMVYLGVNLLMEHLYSTFCDFSFENCCLLAVTIYILYLVIRFQYILSSFDIANYLWHRQLLFRVQKSEASLELFALSIKLGIKYRLRWRPALFILTQTTSRPSRLWSRQSTAEPKYRSVLLRLLFVVICSTAS